MSNAFLGQTVWITGASAGIGRALALEFARQGAAVALSARREERLSALAEQIGEMGRESLVVACDVTDDDDVAGAVQRVVEARGQLDVVVANAGFGVHGHFERLTTDDWRRQFETNVFGLITTVRESLPELRKTNGRIGLVGSVMSMLTIPQAGPYAASKYAVRAIGQTLAQELHGSGVSCTTLYPGFVESEIAQVDNAGSFDPRRKDRRPKRLMWPADRAARVMVRAIRRRKREYVFTGHGKLGGFVGRHAPSLLHFAVTRSGVKPRRRIEAGGE